MGWRAVGRPFSSAPPRWRRSQSGEYGHESPLRRRRRDLQLLTTLRRRKTPLLRKGAHPSTSPPRGICLNGLVIGTNYTPSRPHTQDAIFDFPSSGRGRVAARPEGSPHPLRLAWTLALPFGRDKRGRSRC